MFGIQDSYIKRSVRAGGCCFLAILLVIGCMLPCAAAAASDGSLPTTMFVTKDELTTICAETNQGNGLLATGSQTDVAIRLRLGSRPEAVPYAIDSDYTGKTANAGPITWLVAGSDGDGSVVVYSEEPLGNSAFNKTVLNRDYVGSDNASYKVYPNHWGACDLRTYAQTLSTNTQYFSRQEQDLMAGSVVTSYDSKNDASYTTSDILYAPVIAGTVTDTTGIAVGGGSSAVLIHKAHLGSVHWTRSIDPDGDNPLAIAVIPGEGAAVLDVYRELPSASFAFKLDLSSVLFASAASSATASNSPRRVSDDTPMTLRVSGGMASPLVGATVTEQNGVIRYSSAPYGARLMALFKASDGTVYEYSKPVSGSGQLSLESVVDTLDGLRFEGKVWLESDMEDGGSLVYATEPADVRVNLWGTPITRGDGVVQYVDLNGGTCVALATENISADGMLWLEESVGGLITQFGMELPQGSFTLDQGMRFYVRILTEGDPLYAEVYARLDEAEKARVEADHGLLFCMDVQDANGDTVQPTAPVKVYVQIEENWDAGELQAVRVSPEADGVLPVECVTKGAEGEAERFAVVTIEAISQQYFALDAYTASDAPAQIPPNLNDSEHTGGGDGIGGTELPSDTGAASDTAGDTDPAGEDGSKENKGLTVALVIVSVTVVAAGIGSGAWLLGKKKERAQRPE